MFHVNYLGGDMPTFALNFSRPGNQVAAQYYNFLRLGFDGYKRVQQTSRDVARYCRGRGREAAALRAPHRRERAARVRLHVAGDERASTRCSTSPTACATSGWLVPAYTFPENRQDLAALRIVIRNGMSRDLADLLVADLRKHVELLEQLQAPLPGVKTGGFSH